jgi:alkanesulfonate monooxygenase SsuD/methylene tetrahydromethanopterin reductase-like flavin-dependent oxidoreductase (luciferase family)
LYELFGMSLKKRPSLMERAVDVLKKAWSGEAFEYEGQTVKVLPRPHQQPRPAIIMGGSTKASAERAARIADGFGPVVPELYKDYAEAMQALGKPVPEQAKRRGDYLFLHVSHNPREAWQAIGPHAMHDNNEYASWLQGAPNAVYTPVTHPDELLAKGTYKVVTPDECVELVRKDGALSVKPLVGGLDPAIAWQSLRLIETEVLPRLRS